MVDEAYSLLTEVETRVSRGQITALLRYAYRGACHRGHKRWRIAKPFLDLGAADPSRTDDPRITSLTSGFPQRATTSHQSLPRPHLTRVCAIRIVYQTTPSRRVPPYLAASSEANRKQV